MGLRSTVGLKLLGEYSPFSRLINLGSKFLSFFRAYKKAAQCCGLEERV